MRRRNPEGQPRMKRLRVILLFLLMGAIVNVAVAWVIVLLPTPVDYSDNMVYGLFFDADERWTLNRYEAFGSHFYESRRWKDNTGEEELLRVKELLGGDKIENVKPNWGSMDRTTEFYQALSGPLDHQVSADAVAVTSANRQRRRDCNRGLLLQSHRALRSE